MEGVTSLKAHSSIFSLCSFDIYLLNYIFKSIFKVKCFLGQAYTMML